MNDTTLTMSGNLVADPELRFTPSGVAVANFTVASTPRRFDKAKGEYVDGEALFIRCTVWRDQAEHVAESVRKGSRVMVSGRLESRSWEDRETGDKRYAIELQADEVAVSLKFGQAKFAKIERHRAPPGGDDAWATPAPPPAEAPLDEPPF